MVLAPVVQFVSTELQAASPQMRYCGDPLPEIDVAVEQVNPPVTCTMGEVVSVEVAGSDALAGFEPRGEAGEMGIAGDGAVGMADIDHVAIGMVARSPDDGAGGCGARHEAGEVGLR